MEIVKIIIFAGIGITFVGIGLFVFALGVQEWIKASNAWKNRVR